MFNTPLTESEKKLVWDVLDEDAVMFTDIDSVNEMFTFEDEDSLNCDSEGLNKVLEFEGAN